MSEPDQPNFRVLKIVVVVLGIAILAMTAIIIYTAVDRFGNAVVEEDPAPARHSAPAQPAPAASGETAWSRDLGDGRIVDAALSDGLLMLRTETPGGRATVEIVDPATGRTVGRATGR